MSRRPDERNGRSIRDWLSGDPGGSSGERVRYHGARGLLLVALAAMVTFSFLPTQGIDPPRYSLDTVAPEDVIAQVPFSVPKTPAELQRERRRAVDTIPPTFILSEGAGAIMAVELGRFFDDLDSAAVAGDTLRIGAILRETDITPTPSQMSYVVNDTSRAALRGAAERAALLVLPQGIVDRLQLELQLEDLTTNEITVSRGGAKVRVPVDSVLTSRDFIAQSEFYLPPDWPFRRPAR